VAAMAAGVPFNDLYNGYLKQMQSAYLIRCRHIKSTFSFDAVKPTPIMRRPMAGRWTARLRSRFRSVWNNCSPRLLAR